MKDIVLITGVMSFLLLSGCSSCGGGKADKEKKNLVVVVEVNTCKLDREIPLPWPNPVKRVRESLDASSELRTRLSPIREEMVKRLETKWAEGAKKDTVGTLLDASVELYWVGCHGDNWSIALAAAYLSRLGLRNYELAGMDSGPMGRPCQFRADALRNQIAAKALGEILVDHGTDHEAVAAAKELLNIIEGEVQAIHNEMFNAGRSATTLREHFMEYTSGWYRSLYLKRFNWVELPSSKRRINW